MGKSQNGKETEEFVGSLCLISNQLGFAAWKQHCSRMAQPSSLAALKTYTVALAVPYQ